MREPVDFIAGVEVRRYANEVVEDTDEINATADIRVVIVAGARESERNRVKHPSRASRQSDQTRFPERWAGICDSLIFFWRRKR